MHFKNSLVCGIISFCSTFPNNLKEINETCKDVNHPVIIIPHEITFRMLVSNSLWYMYDE